MCHKNVPMTQILPYLYLGNRSDANNLETLNSNGINYILNLTTSKSEYPSDSKLNVCHVNILDSVHQCLKKTFQVSFDFIDEAQRYNSKVLIHCEAGISRSPTITVAYLIYKKKMEALEAYNLVKELRPIVGPNLGFMGQLIELEKELIPEKVALRLAENKLLEQKQKQLHQQQQQLIIQKTIKNIEMNQINCSNLNDKKQLIAIKPTTLNIDSSHRRSIIPKLNNLCNFKFPKTPISPAEATTPISLLNKKFNNVATIADEAFTAKEFNLTSIVENDSSKFQSKSIQNIEQIATSKSITNKNKLTVSPLKINLNQTEENNSSKKDNISNLKSSSTPSSLSTTITPTLNECKITESKLNINDNLQKSNLNQDQKINRIAKSNSQPQLRINHSLIEIQQFKKVNKTTNNNQNQNQQLITPKSLPTSTVCTPKLKPSSLTSLVIVNKSISTQFSSIISNTNKTINSSSNTVCSSQQQKPVIKPLRPSTLLINATFNNNNKAKYSPSTPSSLCSPLNAFTFSSTLSVPAINNVTSPFDIHNEKLIKKRWLAESNIFQDASNSSDCKKIFKPKKLKNLSLEIK